MEKLSQEKIADLLKSIYNEYHHPEYIHPDPLEFLFRYPDPGDREIVGLIASSFAIGRVNAILDVVELILGKLPEPGKNLMYADNGDLQELFRGFKYRFYDERALVDFLWGIGRVLKIYGSLNECFIQGYRDGGVHSALIFLVQELNAENRPGRSVLPDPSRGSACKRLNLFLRWMVRNDQIDPGGWTGLSPSDLIVPLDTHMHKISLILGFTARQNSDLKSALEITESLKKYDPGDPVRFDFSLTRLGIHPLLDYSRLSD